jgi:hypothetical protein
MKAPGTLENGRSSEFCSTERGGGSGLHRRPAAEAIAEDGEGRLLSLAMQRRGRLAGGKEPAAAALACPAGSAPISPLGRPQGAALPRGCSIGTGTRRSARGSFAAGAHEKPADVLGGELLSDVRDANT